ncbi:hypothetical protein GCM10018779_26940 [Streptomyces griseocarneus]|nr:hypothetical protein GCM10018779_26940 [Streptomyces griseocarneus]
MRGLVVRMRVPVTCVSGIRHLSGRCSSPPPRSFGPYQDSTGFDPPAGHRNVRLCGKGAVRAARGRVEGAYPAGPDSHIPCVSRGDGAAGGKPGRVPAAREVGSDCPKSAVSPVAAGG